jgi:tetratricopeptide (TPR) repeat protein
MLCALVLLFAGLGRADGGDVEFQAKLRVMLGRIESSIHVLREQIAVSQSAPFLSDLYLQLAELLSQKSDALYYIEMEKGETSHAPVVNAQKESIEVDRKILREFPNAPRRARILYRLAAAYRAIDQWPDFMRTAAELVREHPGGEEALRAELLMGQSLFERGELEQARAHFEKVADAPAPYERGVARYRLGLIALARENPRRALELFEQVITDPELKEQEDAVSLKGKGVKSDLKREALTDSVRAFTGLYGSGGDPVGYYARIAPSELLFQEVIEKLSVRYLYQKEFAQAVKLLRVLGERTADPRRVVAIYREVLGRIPVSERATLPLSELRFILGEYRRWLAFFEVSQESRRGAQAFFEAQLRELATRTHELAKASREPADFARASELYLLYLGTFEPSAQSARMAANLADVDYARGDWLGSGEYYLRTYDGEFGPPPSELKAALLDNALLCLQKERPPAPAPDGRFYKEGTGDFYETVRRRGLLIRAIDVYVAASPARKRDPKLAFLRAKTRYEQGLFPEALEDLLSVASRFPASSQAARSGELVLDYFNVRSDFEGLALWSGKLQGARIADAAFTRKLAAIRSRSEARLVQEKVRSSGDFDEFAQGRSFLQAGMKAQDGMLARGALREALAHSRDEGDLETYFKTAVLLGERESDPDERGQIWLAAAREELKVARYYESIGVLSRIYGDPRVPAGERSAAFEQAVRTAALLRDWRTLATLIQDPLWTRISKDALAAARLAWSDALESPVSLPEEVTARLLLLDATEDGWLALFKARSKLSPPLRARVEQRLAEVCAAESRSAVCRWRELAELDRGKERLESSLAGPPATLEAVKAAAPGITELLGSYDRLSGSGDAQLELALQLRSEEIYERFSAYLKGAADANPEVRGVLAAKAAESERAAKAASRRCRQLAGRGATPASRFCGDDATPSVDELVSWTELRPDVAPETDPSGKELPALQGKLLAGRSSELELSRRLFERHDYHHALALATQGLAANPGQKGEFKTLMGCSALQLGYVQEAAYQLREARDPRELSSLNQNCLGQLARLTRVEP